MGTVYQTIRNFFLPRSIGARLAEACAAIEPILKLGNNGEFSYLRIADVARAFRPELHSRGLLLIPSDVECHERYFASDVAGRDYTEVTVKTVFTVSDGRRSEVYSSYGTGRDLDGHALAIAQTGALKAFLKRLGLIFGDRDDPEVEVSPRASSAAESPRARLAQAGYQERAWTSAMRQSGKTEAQIEEYFRSAHGLEVSSALITALPRKEFDVAMEWLTHNGDLEETLELSKKAIAAKGKKAAGPQKIVEELDRVAEPF
jgi:hypothetical protein